MRKTEYDFRLMHFIILNSNALYNNKLEMKHVYEVCHDHFIIFDIDMFEEFDIREELDKEAERPL